VKVDKVIMESYHELLLDLRAKIQQNLSTLNDLEADSRRIVTFELTLPLLDMLHSQLLEQMMNKLDE